MKIYLHNEIKNYKSFISWITATLCVDLYYEIDNINTLEELKKFFDNNYEVSRLYGIYITDNDIPDMVHILDILKKKIDDTPIRVYIYEYISNRYINDNYTDINTDFIISNEYLLNDKNNTPVFSIARTSGLTLFEINQRLVYIYEKIFNLPSENIKRRKYDNLMGYNTREITTPVKSDYKYHLTLKFQSEDTFIREDSILSKLELYLEENGISKDMYSLYIYKDYDYDFFNDSSDKFIIKKVLLENMISDIKITYVSIKLNDKSILKRIDKYIINLIENTYDNTEYANTYITKINKIKPVVRRIICV